LEPGIEFRSGFQKTPPPTGFLLKLRWFLLCALP
jgi:hypothetical protein